MASVIYQRMFMANISFFQKIDNLAAILNLLAYFSQTQPEMHVYLIFYVCTHHKDSKKPYVINVHSRWHLAPSEASRMYIATYLIMYDLYTQYKQCLFHDHSYPIYNTFTFLNTKTLTHD